MSDWQPTPDQERAIQDAFDGRISISLERMCELLDILRLVREACLYVDDDGTICVTEDAVIDSLLFDRICKALNHD